MNSSAIFAVLVLGTASVILADWDIPCGHKIAFGLATYSETVCALEKTNNICGIRTGDSQGKVFSFRCCTMYICFRWLHSLCSQKGIYISTGGRALHTSQLLCKKATRIHKIPSASYDVVTIPGDKKDVSVPLPKTYSSQFTEAAWYDWWEKSGFFQPTTGKEKFVMLMPPPNVTGKLHIGHAFTNSIQDAVVRWNRMRGLSTLWIPGLDHAGIATQVMVEKQLWANEKLTRHDVGRPEFLRLIWNWKHRKAEEIYSQLRRMGLSLDWSKSFFTMDDQVKNAVSNAFCQLYDEGLISRKNRIVNWSCILKSTIADIEVERVDIQGPTSFPVPGYSREVTLGYLTAFAYPVHNSGK
ncbi:Aats-val [Bugula neritina]|uniref:valine--tRNA ligase n=1 Tax=Bugula neritina TaxID=10212 RepID=A0A7J7KHJ4_BUGNE|nr:Aats-val [Bugula neritina]